MQNQYAMSFYIYFYEKKGFSICVSIHKSQRNRFFSKNKLKGFFGFNFNEKSKYIDYLIQNGSLYLVTIKSKNCFAMRSINMYEVLIIKILYYDFFFPKCELWSNFHQTLKAVHKHERFCREILETTTLFSVLFKHLQILITQWIENNSDPQDVSNRILSGMIPLSLLSFHHNNIFVTF